MLASDFVRREGLVINAGNGNVAVDAAQIDFGLCAYAQLVTGVFDGDVACGLGVAVFFSVECTDLRCPYRRSRSDAASCWPTFSGIGQVTLLQVLS